MTKTPGLPPKPSTRDPRQRPGFDPALFPRAHGAAAPPVGSRDPTDRTKLQFLSVYYELNACYANLLQVRAAPPSPARNTAERRILRRIERTLRRRDAIEDHYAPIGILAEPIMQAGFAIDIHFTFATLNNQGRPRSEGCRMSAYMALPRASTEPPGGEPPTGQDGKTDSDQLPGAG
jgi:hypothetical protein